MFKKWLVWWMRAKNQAAHGWQRSLMKSCKWCLPDELSSVSDVFLWKIALIEIDHSLGIVLKALLRPVDCWITPGAHDGASEGLSVHFANSSNFTLKPSWDQCHTQIQFEISVTLRFNLRSESHSDSNWFDSVSVSNSSQIHNGSHSMSFSVSWVKISHCHEEGNLQIHPAFGLKNCHASNALCSQIVSNSQSPAHVSQSSDIMMMNKVTGIEDPWMIWCVYSEATSFTQTMERNCSCHRCFATLQLRSLLWWRGVHWLQLYLDCSCACILKCWVCCIHQHHVCTCIFWERENPFCRRPLAGCCLKPLRPRLTDILQKYSEIAVRRIETLLNEQCLHATHWLVIRKLCLCHPEIGDVMKNLHVCKKDSEHCDVLTAKTGYLLVVTIGAKFANQACSCKRKQSVGLSGRQDSHWWAQHCNMEL